MLQLLLHLLLTLLVVTAVGLAPYGLWVLFRYGRGHHPAGARRPWRHKPVAVVTEP